jgi:hypothetical protein
MAAREAATARLPVAGVFAALAAVVIGAGWHVATRLGVTTSLHPVDLALLRYGVPALIMLPVLLKTGLLPKGAPRGWLALVRPSGSWPPCSAWSTPWARSASRPQFWAA